MINDVLIPHSLYAIAQNINDRLYFRQDWSSTMTDVILQLAPGSYSGASLATQLQSKLDAAFSTGCVPSYI